MVKSVRKQSASHTDFQGIFREENLFLINLSSSGQTKTEGERVLCPHSVQFSN